MSVRRDELLAALRDAGEAGISGELLAGDFGVSRAAIAKHIAALRALGYTINATAGSGYILVSSPDLPLAEEIRPLLRSSFWTHLVGHAETVSTNDDLKTLAREGAVQGSAVVAAHQTAGRGRLGRSWASPTGGVYLSALLRPEQPLAELAPLALVVALGVARGIESLGGAVRLKWPNDVWFDGAGLTGRGGKLAGVLLETSAESDRAEWVVAGVGINVLPPQEPFDGATYLAQEVASAPRLAAVAAAVLDGIAGAYEDFSAAGFGELAREYDARSMLIGRDVRVSGIDGSVRGEGRVLGIDEFGRLVLEGPTGREAISAGDVTLRGSEG